MSDWSVEISRVTLKDGQYRPDTVVLDVILDDEQAKEVMKAVGQAIAMKADMP